ncbi:ABC-1 domain-containing protein [Rhodomicrobium vannielii ATCC 17100]|uniref:ABC-1 domain-containing protein n=1 Tax=Rhodomicrobium vannielii (strain ATCC 17100 / DSM 162 / LMG 4299 / NCIMB 10020 / ATH 3.1.1) TaxID=648757 RepID=E3I504_RHOVT|nr:AarF/ABC1/UbiB kinase family protein [Rhodomicrobium vannielii]ADP69358.1 ABC-1 domain-containing protein [Rhodomicrobium vannielii ATCC 17100]
MQDKPDTPKDATALPKLDAALPGDGDREGNRLSQRVQRYARVGTNVGGVAARLGAAYLMGGADRQKNAQSLAAALGGLKGPLMKVAQLLSTVPDAIPPEYAAELAQLQNQAPAMGWPFVRRRMSAELGPDWQAKFADFGHEAAAAASLGQVHKARALDGRSLAVKLQYPEMQSAVEADLNQLQIVMGLYKRMDAALDTSEMVGEIGARLREELDYTLEARHMALYAHIFQGDETIRVPELLPDLSTKRLLTMTWLDGRKLLDYKTRPLEERNTIARALFRAWWYPFSHYAVIHGDPHLGNYTIFEDGDGRAAGINLLDYGCIRTFKPKFVGGVIDLYNGLRTNDRALIVHAYETWGFKGLSNELIDILNIWAGFIYGPLLDDRVRSVAEGVAPNEYGRREVFRVHQGLREKGPVKIPREFVFMDRAAIGLGAVFLHLQTEMNFYRAFNEVIEDFRRDEVGARQEAAFKATGVPLPV